MRPASFTLFATATAAWLIACCGDAQAPTWPDGAELTVKDVLATSATLDWPPALDNEGIAGYRIFKGEEKVAEVGAGAAFYEMDDLTEVTEYTFTIEAHDAAGNTSPRMDLTFSTADGTPPAWPDGAALKVAEAL